MRRLSVTYSARPGSFDFYVMQSLPIESAGDASVLKVDSNGFAKFRRVGSAIDDGTHGVASIEIPATSGRYLMVRWIPAVHEDTSFTVAEISAVGTGGAPLLASSGRYMSTQPTSERSVAIDAKDVPDAKDVYETKDVPAEAPALPPPALPDLPPFAFIPRISPVSQ